MTHDTRPDDHSGIALPAGTSIGEHYRVLGVLGRPGGFGITYLAHDTQLDMRVAIREFLPRELAGRKTGGPTVVPHSPRDEELFRVGLEAFVKEARAVVRLDHPNVVRVREFFEAHDTAYLVMDYYEGATLAEVVQRRGGRLDWPVAVEVMLRVLDGLAAAHAENVLHRDVKPENIFITTGGRPLLMDFGAARQAIGEQARNLTAVLTPGYAPIEQYATIGRQGPWSDVYACAAVLYTVITGQRPPDAFERTMRETELLPPGTLVPGLPPAVGAAIMRGLSVEPVRRPQSARELRELLDRLPDDGAPPAQRGADPARTLDDDVQFTVYRPAVVRPAEWYPLLAFAHLSEAPPGTREPDPKEEVERQANRILGGQTGEFRKVVQDSAQPLPREGTITFVPAIEGFDFNPPQRSFQWRESVHREEFRLRAAARLDGTTARGTMTVYHGVIILAELTLSIRVDSAHRSKQAQAPVEPVRATPFRRIFASYSHKDLEIVRQFERYAQALGDRYVRDWTELRAGEVWNERLLALIREADVLQLFWSWNAMASPYVRQEWEYALSLGRPHFVRPIYWEEPLPETPDHSLPPEALRRLHFQKLQLLPDAATGGRTVPRPPAAPPHPPGDFTRIFRSATDPPPAREVDNAMMTSPPAPPAMKPPFEQDELTRILGSIGAPSAHRPPPRPSASAPPARSSEFTHVVGRMQTPPSTSVRVEANRPPDLAEQPPPAARRSLGPLIIVLTLIALIALVLYFVRTT